jgi:MFS family permease
MQRIPAPSSPGPRQLFNDFASDIVIPIVPLLLATVLAAGPAALGVIEGVAEAVASLLKLWAGRRTDVTRGRRKTLVFAGYLLSNVTRPLLAIATSWLGVLALRSIDRVGKGIRSAPRDAMIADVVTSENAGRAYGLHRALDNAGAVLGGLPPRACPRGTPTATYGRSLVLTIPA